MNRRSFFTFLFAAIGLVTLQASAANAQDEPREVVSFRLAAWKTQHMNDAKAAASMVETLKNIGCEARQSNHGNHIDVSYRCTTWKSIALKTHTDAHRWENWLKQRGFETQHKH